MRLGLVVLAWAGLAAGLGVACGGDSGPESSRIFSAGPWQGAERHTYNLVQRGGDIYGQCALETVPEGGRLRLRRLCNDGRNSDDGEAEVQAATLQPVSSTRVIVNADSGKTTTIQSTYEQAKVRFSLEVEGKTTETERDLPQAGDDDSLEPGWYDDESLLWLVRGMPLRAGYEGGYHNVNASTGRVFKVEVRVEGREQVRVPAGTFDTWVVVVESQSISQKIWVEAVAPNRVVKARIERLTYELTR